MTKRGEVQENEESNKVKTNKVRKQSLQYKIMIPLVILEILICVTLGLVLGHRMKTSMVSMGCDEAAIVAGYTAKQLNAEDVTKLVQADDAQLYQSICAELQKQVETGDVKYCYLLYTDSSSVYYAADNESEEAYGSTFEENYTHLR